MACKCGTEKKPDAPEQFIIYRAEVVKLLLDVDKSRKTEFTPKRFTDNAVSFSPRDLVPADAFDTQDFCSRPASASFVPQMGGESLLVIAAQNAVIEGRWRDYCRCKPNCAAPPFRGGQCECVRYVIHYHLFGFGDDSAVRTDYGVGPLRWQTDILSDGRTSRYILGGHPPSCANTVSCAVTTAYPDYYYVEVIDVSRYDGLPDLCGDLPTYDPPYFPDFVYPKLDFGVPFPIPAPIPAPIPIPIPIPIAPTVDVPLPTVSPPPMLYVPPTVPPPIIDINPAPNPPNGCPCASVPPAPPIVRYVEVQGPPGPQGLQGKDGKDGKDAMVKFVSASVPKTVSHSDGVPTIGSIDVSVVANDDGQSEADLVTHLLNEITALRTEGVSVSRGVVEPVLLFSASVSASNPVVISTPIPTNVRSIIVKVSGSLGSAPRKFVLAGDETEYLLGHISFWNDGAMLLPRYEMSTMKSRLPVPHSATPLRVRFSARFDGMVEIYDSGERWNQPINQ